MLGYSGGQARSLLADGGFEALITVGVTDDVASGIVVNLASNQLPFAFTPTHLVVLTAPVSPGAVGQPLSVVPFAVARPEAVRGGSFVPNDAVFLLTPESWHYSGVGGGFSVPIGSCAMLPMTSVALPRYYGLGANIAHSAGADVHVSLIWGVISSESE